MINARQIKSVFNKGNLENDLNYLKNYGGGGSSTGGSLSVKTNQTVIFDITASNDTPYVKEIDINTTNKFDNLPISVYRITPGINNEINILADFNSDDKKDFFENNLVTFNGNLKLKTEYELKAHRIYQDEDGSVYELEFDIDLFEKIKGIEVV